jgi:RNA polymerase sigma-70 factor (ECF subfamily)
MGILWAFGAGAPALPLGAMTATVQSDEQRADGEESLVSLAREGDHKAFEQLVRKTSPACYSLAVRLVGNEHDAGDVLQEAYLRAYRSLRRFRGDSAFSTWLHRITVNCAADLLDQRQKASHDVLDDCGACGGLVEMRAERDPEAAAGINDDRQRLVEALRELPDELRLVVVLRDVYDLAHRDIAKELGISQGAAKVRLHRARLRLRQRLFPPWPAVLRAEDLPGLVDERAWAGPGQQSKGEPPGGAAIVALAERSRQ